MLPPIRPKPIIAICICPRARQNGLFNRRTQTVMARKCGPPRWKRRIFDPDRIFLIRPGFRRISTGLPAVAGHDRSYLKYASGQGLFKGGCQCAEPAGHVVKMYAHGTAASLVQNIEITL